MDNQNLEVLIVDDDEMTTFLHQVYVKEANLDPNPRIFYNGKDALDHFLTYYNRSKQYCILLDINMPILNSWELLDKLYEKEMTPNIAVVILTSSINIDDKEKANSYDCVIDYIEKPLKSASIESIKKHPQLKEYF